MPVFALQLPSKCRASFWVDRRAITISAKTDGQTDSKTNCKAQRKCILTCTTELINGNYDEALTEVCAQRELRMSKVLCCVALGEGALIRWKAAATGSRNVGTKGSSATAVTAASARYNESRGWLSHVVRRLKSSSRCHSHNADRHRCTAPKGARGNRA